MAIPPCITHLNILSRIFVPVCIIAGPLLCDKLDSSLRAPSSFSRSISVWVLGSWTSTYVRIPVDSSASALSRAIHHLREIMFLGGGHGGGKRLKTCIWFLLHLLRIVVPPNKLGFPWKHRSPPGPRPLPLPAHLPHLRPSWV